MNHIGEVTGWTTPYADELQQEEQPIEKVIIKRSIILGGYFAIVRNYANERIIGYDQTIQLALEDLEYKYEEETGNELKNYTWI